MSKVQIVFTLCITAAGLIVGGLWGLMQDAGYEARHVVMADQALQTPDYEPGPRTAAFIIAMNRVETRERAAESTGQSPEEFEGIYAARVEDSSLIEVIGTSASASGLSDRINALSEATLLELIDQERASADVIVETTASELTTLEEHLDQLADQTGVAPDADFENRLQDDRFSLASTEAQLSGLPDDETYWNVRLPGEIKALTDRIDAVSLVLDDWRATRDRIDAIEESSGSAISRLTELESARSIVLSGSAVLASEPSVLPKRIAVGRWAAIGAAAGFLGAVGAVATGLFSSRRFRGPVVNDVPATVGP